MRDSLLRLKNDALAAILDAENAETLEDVYATYLSKKGRLALAFKEVTTLPVSERAEFGRLANEVKNVLTNAYQEARQQFSDTQHSQIKETEWTDITKPGLTLTHGSLHPITQFQTRVREIFSYLGFQEVEAPHVELDTYNFEYLNIPPHHPSRDLWDTLYVDTAGSSYQPGSVLLRTHTSNMQVRVMEQVKPPLRSMTFDRCFRYELLDARHSHTFSQFEVLMVDKGVTMSTLKGISDYFLKAILGEKSRSRFRPKYYPFVEPGVGIDALCVFCEGKGCRTCSGVGWFEIAGAGMVHPRVLKNGGIDPSQYTGFAWGFGPDRMLMLQSGIEDIRLLYSNDVRFLRQF